MATAIYKLNKLNDRMRLDIRIKLSKQFRLRFKAATLLFRLGAKILGCAITIKTES